MRKIFKNVYLTLSWFLTAQTTSFINLDEYDAERIRTERTMGPLWMPNPLYGGLVFTAVSGIPGAEATVGLKDTSRSTCLTLAFERFAPLFSFIARGPFLFKGKETFEPVFC